MVLEIRCKNIQLRKLVNKVDSKVDRFKLCIIISFWLIIQLSNALLGSLGIVTSRNCTHFLKIGFLVAGGRFHSYNINQGNKSDKEMKIVRKS